MPQRIMTPAEEAQVAAGKAASAEAIERMNRQVAAGRTSRYPDNPAVHAIEPKAAAEMMMPYNNLSPVERQQARFNQQLRDYYEQQLPHEYQLQSHLMNQNQNYGNQGFGQNMSISRPVMNELISMINSQPTRYVPIRPRPSINDRVMNSFGQNMFSPEFIPEEE